MFSRLMPKGARFFDLFNAHAAIAKECSRELVSLLSNMNERTALVAAIETCEKKADKVTHDTIELLHRSFITPLDRDQIHSLITTMDDILDLMEDVAQALHLYDIRMVTPEARQLAEIGVQCCDRLGMVVGMMHDLTDTAGILKICAEIDQLESDADRVMRSAMARLFRDEADTRQLIKMKAVYEMLEEITDRCEDVAKLIEGIVLENA